MLAIETFALMVGFSIFGILLMAVKMHREAMTYVNDLQFFLKHRTIAHNQVKAQLSVMESNFDKLKNENEELKAMLVKIEDGKGFEGTLPEADFVESQEKRLEELSAEIG